MATISSLLRSASTDNTLSLFNSLSSTSSVSSTSSTSSTSNLLGIDLAEYSSITRGSYSKLVKAYYSKYGSKSSSNAEDESTTKEKTIKNTTIKNAANDLYKAAHTLVSTGKDSLFKKVEIEDKETGTTTKGYDTDKIYKAVNTLVDAYNSLVENSTDSSDHAVLRQTLNMVNSASSNRSLLNDVGITIGSDNKLSVDEETFKKADMTTVKSLLNGNGSFGAKIQSAASTVYMRINNSFGNSNTYTASGTLGNYSTGNLLDSLL